MEETGEQSTVVFTLIVTEQANECMCVYVWVWGCYTPLHPLAGSGTIHAKTTVNCSPDSSMVAPHSPL
jgi:hypothetical protein